MTQTNFMISTEAARSKPPTENDISDTEQLFNDFGIVIDIPKFKTYADLERWRVKQVLTFLENSEYENEEEVINNVS